MNSTSSVSTVQAAHKGAVDLVYSAADQVLSLAQGATPLHAVSDFMDSVRWTEPFIGTIIALQLVLFAVTYSTRRNTVVQFALLGALTGVSLGAERLNTWGHAHWRRFATQDYFDSAGFFMMTFVCGPFVLLANFIVITMALRLVKLHAIKSRRQAARARSAAPASAGGAALPVRDGSKKDS